MMNESGHEKPFHEQSRPPGPRMLRTLIILLGLAGLFLLIAGSLGWREAADRRQDLENLNKGLAALFKETDEKSKPLQIEDLKQAAEKVGAHLPEADYASLHQRWSQVLGQFDQVNAALANRYLKPRAPELLKGLHEQLLALRDAATESLKTASSPSPQLSWRLHNLRGCVSVLLAYSLLYLEEDAPKATKFLTDALEDFKQAIRLVDGASLSSLERVLPRWNLELIVGIGEQRLVGLSDLAAIDPAEIREQLQAFIPEIPGFAPGVPLETRVEK